MAAIQRALAKQIKKRFKDHKVIVLYGARQTGKTTLVREVIRGKKHLWLNADESDVRELLTETTSSRLKAIIGNHPCLVIDEAQRIENIGLTLKLITDEIGDVKVIASGSSSFELSNKIKEPLTGRKWEFLLYPLSYAEMCSHNSPLEERRLLNHRLIYGYYPEVVKYPEAAVALLNELSESYLYKDILSLGDIRKPHQLQKLLQSLALQLGNEVSYHELSQMCGLNSETVESYIDILEKAFIVFRLTALSRNIRNEIKKSKKIYFFDNGIRNSIIRQFNPLELRNDTGALWENFLISERFKRNTAGGFSPNLFFWRTHARQEIDYIEEQNGMLETFEFKWNPAKERKVPRAFGAAYPEHTFATITPKNFEKFVL